MLWDDPEDDCSQFGSAVEEDVDACRRFEDAQLETCRSIAEGLCCSYWLLQFVKTDRGIMGMFVKVGEMWLGKECNGPLLTCCCWLCAVR